jgi:hypothetical protein
MHETADVAHALASMDIMHPTGRAVWRIEDTKNTRHQTMERLRHEIDSGPAKAAHGAHPRV